MKLSARLKDESGQAMILTLLCMTCLLGFVGFAADIGTLLNAKRQMQTAADSAAIAGALEQAYGDTVTAGQAAAAQNGVTNGLNGGVVTINPTALSGAYAGQTGYVEAIVSQSEPTFFMKMFNFTSMTVSARAVATLGNGQTCVYTLSPTGASNPNLKGADFYLYGSDVISIPTCGIIDNSSSSNGLDFNGSFIVTTKSIGVVGGYSEQGSSIVNPTPITGVEPAPDPLASLPEPSVPSSCPTGNYSTGNTTLSPGCFGGLSISGAANITLNPGVYVIDGNLNVSGATTISGTGVTIYITGGGSVTLQGSETWNISAPTSGTYNGILFEQDRNDPSPFTFTGSAVMNMQGIFYFPDADITLDGSVAGNLYADFVSNTFSDIGSAVWKDYALVNSNSPLTSARLVE